MGMVQESIEVDVELSVAYRQWTRFEDFPRFMEGVEEVTRIDGSRNHWKTRVAGVSREFDTEIVDQRPDRKIAWHTIGGEVRQMGVVTFDALDDHRTAVRLAIDFEPTGVAEKAADLIGVIDRRVKGDLRRFKSFVEQPGTTDDDHPDRPTPA